MSIGYNGQTLKEMLELKDRQFEETGCIHGLEELTVLDEDPVKLMKFQSRLISGCVSARETGKLVAASPSSILMGELLFMVGTPEGDMVCTSHGLVGHIQCMPAFIRAMIEMDYEENPGIKDGDIFSTNDGKFGSPHASDCFLAMPVFHEGELVAWTAAMNHISEVGGVVSGNLPSFSANSFTDGFTYPPIKSGENFRQNRWWELLWERRTRLGRINVLDDKMRAAGAIALHKIVNETIEEFGIDYFRQANREVLERERVHLTELVQRQTVPGTYSTLGFKTMRYKGMTGQLFPNSEKDWLLHFPMETTIDKKAKVNLNLDGLSSEADFHGNMYTPGLKAMATLGLWPMVAHSATTNTALLYITDWNVPPGSMGNPMNPFAPVSMGVGVLGGVYAFQFQHAFSMAFFAKGFIEECFFRSPAMMGYGIDGIFEDGTRWAGGNFSQIGSASSAALPYKDGEFEIAAMTNPESDMGESEILEFLEPALINLGKKLVPDFCGHGKYKGGMGLSTSQLVVEPGAYLSLAVFANCPSETTPLAVGAMGGYPALGTVAYFLHDTNMKEIIENGQQYPRDFAEARNMLAEGTLKAGKVSFHKGNSPSTPLKDGDMFLLGNHANGGYGDPIERDPSMLEDDMKNNFLTKDVIKKIYGAILDDDGKANAKETDAERQKIRDNRKENSMDVKDWWKQEREKVVNKDFSELVYNMYKDIMKYGKFNTQMKKMWLLEDYTL